MLTAVRSWLLRCTAEESLSRSYSSGPGTTVDDPFLGSGQCGGASAAHGRQVPNLEGQGVTPLFVSEIKAILGVCEQRRNGTRWTIGMRSACARANRSACP